MAEKDGPVFDPVKLELAISHPTRVTNHLSSLMPFVLFTVSVGSQWAR